MLTVVAVHNLSEPCTDVGNRLVHAEAQFCLNCVQLCHHAFFAVFRQTMNAPALPAVMRETQERKGLRLSFSTLLPISGGIPWGERKHSKDV
jgi:hypothetical protein